jgi:ribosomal protein S12 methylthiotransferase
MKTVHLTSLGCPKNFVDSEVILGLLNQCGWKVVEKPEDAAVLLVNTCGFIQPAVEESIDIILELAAVKKQSAGTRLVVTGCMVQRYELKLKEEIPEIDLLVGTEGVREIHTILEKLDNDSPCPEIHMPDRFLMDSSLPRVLATPSFRAWMKITEGCDNRCSYCMIPSIRGELRSRSVRDLMEEAMLLENKGVKELSLIAQDLTAFSTEKNQASQLTHLLSELLAATEIPWIRLLYLYPTGIDDRMLELMAANSRIVPYLDIPFQHVSSAILKRMNRPYTGDMLVSLVEKIRRILPEIALRTTFLVGFPGETEADVDELAAFLSSMRIDHVGVFAYSNEEGSPSEFFENQISEEEKQARVEHIHTLQASISSDIQQKYVGKIEQVLVEGVSEETDLLLEGRTRFQAPDIDGCVLINEGTANPGDIVKVRISESHTYDLVGAIIQ